MGIWPNSAGIIPRWSPTRIIQMVLIGWISRSRGQKLGFQNHLEVLYQYLVDKWRKGLNLTNIEHIEHISNCIMFVLTSLHVWYWTVSCSTLIYPCMLYCRVIWTHVRGGLCLDTRCLELSSTLKMVCSIVVYYYFEKIWQGVSSLKDNSVLSCLVILITIRRPVS